VLAVTIAPALLRFREVPLWARVRLAVGLLLLGLGTAIGGLVALGAAVAGAVLLAGAAAALLRHAIEAEKLEVEELHQRLLTVEVGRREDRARLHEINATVAGIASAQQLMTEGLPLDRTDALSTMVRGEVERLQRLVSDSGPSRRRSVDLDETIGRIVLSHLARGRIVVWERTGLRAVGRADEIAEILNILLENAAVHGGPDAVSVSVAPGPDGPGVTITVSDQGPGIAPDVRDRIFDWGVSGPGSPGQGIGLHLAASLAHELGGRLELLPTAAGASFALHLEAAEAGMGAREHVA
jgi:signal transduction histidine kinase